MIKKTLLSFVAVCIFSTGGALFATKSEVSKLRIKKITEIIKRYKNANEKLSDPYVQDAIFDEVGNSLILEPEEKPNEMPIKEIASIVRKKVKKRFPYSIKEIKKKAKKEAEKKYKMPKKLDFVTITVVKGRTSYSISGIFYGFGVGGNSVRIGDNRPIAFFDLSPDSRAKFDEEFCKRRKKEFIDNKVRSYYLRKNSYTDNLFQKMRKKIIEENEGLGYIYSWGRWRTAKNITKYLIEKLKAEHQKETTTVALNTEDSIDFDTEKPDELPDAMLNHETEITDEDSTEQTGTSANNLKLSKLKSSIEEQQLEISGSQYGVDADQGIVKDGKRILWGLTVNEVNLIFQDDLKQKPSPSEIGDHFSETLNYDHGPISSITLYFINKIFYKATTNYRIGPPEAMRLLWTKYNDKYGEAIEPIQMRKAEEARLARLAAIKKLCPKNKKGKDTHKWDKKTGKCKVCGVKKRDLYPPPPPLDQTYTWAGKITTAILQVSMTKEHNFRKFVLTKENKSIKEEMEKILEAERKKRTEEENKKQLEEYQSIE